MSVIYIDGSGFNGTKSRYAIAFENGNTIIEEIKEKKTNNQMEYAALIRALEECSEGDHIYTDSQLLVGQVVKGWKCTKQHLFPLMMKAKKLVEEKKVKLRWVNRKDNLAGNLLEK